MEKKPYDLAKELCSEARAAGLTATVHASGEEAWTVAVKVSDELTLTYYIDWAWDDDGLMPMVLSSKGEHPIRRSPFNRWREFFEGVAAALKK